MSHQHQHHMASHHITSHYITSYHITSHHITSHHITSHHITSHHIASHPIASHHITSHAYNTSHAWLTHSSCNVDSVNRLDGGTTRTAAAVARIPCCRPPSICCFTTRSMRSNSVMRCVMSCCDSVCCVRIDMSVDVCGVCGHTM